MRYTFNQIAALEYLVKDLGNLNADIIWSFNNQLVNFNIFCEGNGYLGYVSYDSNGNAYVKEITFKTSKLALEFQNNFANNNGNIKFVNYPGLFLQQANDLIQKIPKNDLYFELNIPKILYNFKKINVKNDYLDFRLFDENDEIYPVSLRLN